MNRVHDLDVEQVKMAILRFARDRNIESDVLVQAMAEVIGMTAAALEQTGATCSFDERMKAVVDHARISYYRKADAFSVVKM